MVMRATIKRKLGELEEAEHLLTESLKITVAAYGKYHPSVGETLSNLALVFADQERFDEAEDSCQYAISLLEDALGAFHPLWAGPINNLGMIYFQQSRYSEAE